MPLQIPVELFVCSNCIHHKPCNLPQKGKEICIDFLSIDQRYGQPKSLGKTWPKPPRVHKASWKCEKCNVVFGRKTVTPSHPDGLCPQCGASSIVKVT